MSLVFWYEFSSLVTGPETRSQSLSDGGGMWRGLLFPVGIVMVLVSFSVMEASSSRAGRGRFWEWCEEARRGAYMGVQVERASAGLSRASMGFCSGERS